MLLNRCILLPFNIISFIVYVWLPLLQELKSLTIDSKLHLLQSFDISGFFPFSFLIYSSCFLLSFYYHFVIFQVQTRENIALGKSIVATSTTGLPGNTTVDGVLVPTRDHWKCFQTAPDDPKPFLRIDLGDEYIVERLILTAPSGDDGKNYPLASEKRTWSDIFESKPSKEN